MATEEKLKTLDISAKGTSSNIDRGSSWFPLTEEGDNIDRYLRMIGSAIGVILLFIAEGELHIQDANCYLIPVLILAGIFWHQASIMDHPK